MIILSWCEARLTLLRVLGVFLIKEDIAIMPLVNDPGAFDEKFA